MRRVAVLALVAAVAAACLPVSAGAQAPTWPASLNLSIATGASASSIADLWTLRPTMRGDAYTAPIAIEIRIPAMDATTTRLKIQSCPTGLAASCADVYVLAAGSLMLHVVPLSAAGTATTVWLTPAEWASPRYLRVVAQDAVPADDVQAAPRLITLSARPF